MEPRHLRAWSLRAAALAWPSAALVLLAKYSAASLLAMVLGTATYALAFAHVASRIGPSSRHRRWWAALEKAAWVKAACSFAALPAWGLVVLLGLRPSFLFPFFAAVVLDQLTGALSMAIGTHFYECVFPKAPLHASFPQTLLITLLQGACITLTLIPITIAVIAWQNIQQTRTFQRPFR